MNSDVEIWRPGSFTKNFSWGRRGSGLELLHEIIRRGFNNQMEDVPRTLFRERIAATGLPDFIPINFFLFNKPKGGTDFLSADELVFQALNWEHSENFDKLALFAFNFSFVGTWKGARDGQRRPALWANAYIRERLAHTLRWNTSKVTADDIEQFVANDKRYLAKTSRKLATNLNYIYRLGRLSAYPSARIQRWWVDCLFLAFDRLIEDRLLDGKSTPDSQLQSLLHYYGFLPLTGPTTLEKELAIPHLIGLYAACGGRDRFSEEAVAERTNILVPELAGHLLNDARARGALHPSNPRILKTIPMICAMLARYAGFKDIGPDEIDNFDLKEFISDHTQNALRDLGEKNIKPSMTSEELIKVTREK